MKARETWRRGYESLMMANDGTENKGERGAEKACARARSLQNLRISRAGRGATRLRRAGAPKPDKQQTTAPSHPASKAATPRRVVEARARA